MAAAPEPRLCESPAIESGIYGLLVDAAERVGSRPALTFLEIDDLNLVGEEPDRMSHTSLLAAVTKAANAFARLGVGRENVVSILAPSIPDGMIALWAAETAGIANPVNYLLQRSDIVAALNSVESKIVVVYGPDPQIDIWNKLENLRADVSSIEHVVTIGSRAPDTCEVPALRDLMDRESGDRLGVAPFSGPDDAAAYFLTAGTTGLPKVVVQSHGNQRYAATSLATMLGFDAATRIVNALPFFHVAGSILLGLAPLSAGAEILLPTAIGLRNPEVVARHWEIVDAFRPNIIGGIPTSLVSLLDVNKKNADLRGIRFCVTGGAPLPISVAEAFTARFGISIHEIYGMSECSGLIACAPADRSPTYGRSGRLPEGTVVEARQIKANGQVGDALRTGEAGVLVVRGPQVFKGYLNHTQTTEAFTDDGWFISGDIGFVDEFGMVTITGRSKDVIIRGGHNIDPGTIEKAAKGFSGIVSAAAVGMPDAYAGEVPVIYITAQEGSKIDLDSFSRHLRRYIDEDRTLPVEIFVISEMPLTPLGKLSRLALREDCACLAARRACEAALPSSKLTVAVRSSRTGKLEAVVAGIVNENDAQALRQAITGLNLDIVFDKS